MWVIRFFPTFESWHWKYLNASSKNHLFFNIFDYFQYKNFLHIHVGDTIQEKQVLYTFDTKQSFGNLIKKLDAHQLGSYKDLWLAKQKHSGIASSIVDFKQYHVDNRYDTQSEASARRMALVPVDFGFGGYLLANRLYERVYGVYFDDVVGK